jgi:hypothetical protein
MPKTTDGSLRTGNLKTSEIGWNTPGCSGRILAHKVPMESTEVPDSGKSQSEDAP